MPGAEGREEAEMVPTWEEIVTEAATANRQRIETKRPGQRWPRGIQSPGEAEEDLGSPSPPWQPEGAF